MSHREQGERPAKKRAGASTDMVPSKQRVAKTDIRNFEPPSQYDISPQRKGMPVYQQSPVGAKNQYNSGAMAGPSVSHSLDIPNFRPQQQRMPPQMHNAQSMQGLGQYQQQGYP